MKRSNLTAWLLILAGGFLLLNHFGLFLFNRAVIAIIISIFFSIVFINRAIHNSDRKGMVGAGFFTLLAIVLVGMQLGLFPVDDRLGAGLVLLSLGFSNLIYYLVTRNKISNLIWAFIFIAIGIPFLIGYYDLMPLWIIEDYYATYWPGLLIFIGLVVLIDGLLRRRRKVSDDSYHG